MWKFIKKLFCRKKKVISHGTLPIVKEVMRPRQIIKAMNYYKEHTQHVQKLMKQSFVAFDVSLEDRNNPSLWKPGHWLWFFDKHKK